MSGTYVDVVGQEVVGGLVLAQEVRVDGASGEDGSEEETEEAVVLIKGQVSFRGSHMSSNRIALESSSVSLPSMTRIEMRLYETG